MANGKVITGFSDPFVALYSATGTTVTYSGGMPLARGVSAELSVEGASGNNFYADNVLAENGDSVFQSGTLTLEVDGLKEAAKKLIQGLTATKSVTAGSATVTLNQYDDTQEVPYVGVGYVVRYMEDGEITYSAEIFPKVKFAISNISAATQGESIEFQTATLEGTIFRDDTAAHAWYLEDTVGQASQETAVAVIKSVLGIS